MAFIDLAGSNNYRITCDVCGKFAKLDDHHTEFTPDSPFTIEHTDYFCRKCGDKHIAFCKTHNLPQGC